jgi:TatA/E family protein of Tat protein translocase
MFGSIGGPELLLLFVLALLIFGPRKLPEIGKTIGKTLGEFKRATTDFKSSLEREVEVEKLREVRSEIAAPLALPSLDPLRAMEPVPYGGPGARPTVPDSATGSTAPGATGQGESTAGDATGDPGGGDGRRDG